VQTAATGSTSQVMVAADAWPWDRPSTTVLNDERIPPPGHHSGSYMSEGVKLSERARLILQGFPEGWQLLAPTKTGRSSMLGQAMPPPLAEAVARATIEQARDDGGGT
jgi:site-specific DNA-cytosine methylase